MQGGATCLPHLCMDTWRWSVCSLMQEPTRTSQCRVAPHSLARRIWEWTPGDGPLLSDAGADDDIAMQGGAAPLFVASQQGRRELVCSRMQGPTRISQCRAMPLPCSSNLRMDTWRLSACSLMQGPARTSQIRMVAFPCSSHLRMDTWRWSVCCQNKSNENIEKQVVALFYVFSLYFENNENNEHN